MEPIKNFLASLILNKTFHFKCTCIIPFDIIGTVVDYIINDSEIIFTVQEKETGKYITISSNQPNLEIGLDSL